MVMVIELLGYTAPMPSERPRSRLFASKAGFVFLMISLALLILFFASCGLEFTIFTGGFLTELLLGAQSVWVESRSGAVGLWVWINADFSSGVYFERSIWSWPHEFWPKYEAGSLGFSPSYCRHLVLPIWMLIIPLTLMSWYFYRRARRKRLIDHCRKCEYDLTGNTSGVCPECGMPIETST